MVPEESKSVMEGNSQTWWLEQQAKSSCLELQPGSRENKLEIGEALCSQSDILSNVLLQQSHIS